MFVAAEEANFPVSWRDAVSVLKRVVLPTLGRPRIPSCIAAGRLAEAAAPGGAHALSRDQASRREAQPSTSADGSWSAMRFSSILCSRYAFRPASKKLK